MTFSKMYLEVNYKMCGAADK